MKLDLTKDDVAALRIVVDALKYLGYDGLEADKYMRRADSAVRRLERQVSRALSSPVPKRAKKARKA